MRYIEMPTAGFTAPQVILGMMRIAEKTDEEIRVLVNAAREAGVDYVDHADIYSPGLSVHECERRFAQAVQLSAAERERLTIQTKVGIIKDGPLYDFSYEHITASLDESLRALGTDYVDVLLLHRPDPLVEPQEVARAFDHLHSSGKVKHFGVSNHTPAQMELLRRTLDQPLAVNQLQLSLPHAAVLTGGIMANTLGLPPISPRMGPVWWSTAGCMGFRCRPGRPTSHLQVFSSATRITPSSMRRWIPWLSAMG